MSIERKNILGFTSWAIIDDVDGSEVMSCPTYYFAVEALGMLKGTV